MGGEWSRNSNKIELYVVFKAEEAQNKSSQSMGKVYEKAMW